MTIKFLLLSTFLLATLISASCQPKAEKAVQKKSFFTLVTELKEFKDEDKRADSLKQAGASFEISISIIDDSPFPEDAQKNLSIGLIQYDFGPDELMLYKVKYDKAKEKIISLEKTYTVADLKRYGLVK